MNPSDPSLAILVPGTAVPVANLIPADGQYVDAAGNPMPFIDPSGDFSTTTTDPIAAGKTAVVTVADAGLSVGDWVVLSNGASTDLPRQVLNVLGSMITMSSAFGISASGTSTLTATRVTPSLSWVLSGKPFGQLDYTAGKLTGLIEVQSSKSNISSATITAQILVNGAVKATKVGRIGSGSTDCQMAQQAAAEVVQFGIAATLAPGVDCRVRAYATFAYAKVCNIRGGTFTLGPRLGPVYTV